MKCDDLENKDYNNGMTAYELMEENGLVNTAKTVKDAIAELKAENARLKKCEIWMKQHFYCEEVIACESAKNRQLKRALWLARADRAMMTLDYFTLKCKWFKDYMKVEPPGCDVKMVHKWANVQAKCLKKAEEYK